MPTTGLPAFIAAIEAQLALWRAAGWSVSPLRSESADRWFYDKTDGFSALLYRCEMRPPLGWPSFDYGEIEASAHLKGCAVVVTAGSSAGTGMRPASAGDVVPALRRIVGAATPDAQIIADVWSPHLGRLDDDAAAALAAEAALTWHGLGTEALTAAARGTLMGKDVSRASWPYVIPTPPGGWQEAALEELAARLVASPR